MSIVSHRYPSIIYPTVCDPHSVSADQDEVPVFVRLKLGTCGNEDIQRESLQA